MTLALSLSLWLLPFFHPFPVFTARFLRQSNTSMKSIKARIQQYKGPPTIWNAFISALSGHSATDCKVYLIRQFVSVWPRYTCVYNLPHAFISNCVGYFSFRPYVCRLWATMDYSFCWIYFCSITAALSHAASLWNKFSSFMPEHITACKGKDNTGQVQPKRTKESCYKINTGL